MALFGLAAVILGTLVGYITYALYIHPLARYPGPLLGRLTQWYDVYHAFVGDKHVNFLRLHQKYGPVVRFSPNTVSLNDPAALKAIYAHGANVQKSTFYKCFRSAPTAVSTLLATEKDHHARKRRVMAQAFSADAMRGLEQYVVGHVQDLIDKVDDLVEQQEKGQWSGSVNAAEYLNWLVFDIMGELVFSKSFNALGGNLKNREGIRLLGRAAKRNYVVAAMPILAQRGLEKWLPFLRSLYLDRAKYLAFGKAQAMARMKENGFGESGRRDIFSFLLHAKDPEGDTGEGFSKPELFMEANTLIVAGSDTSSTTMSAVLFYLLHNPQALRRLENEVRSTFVAVDDIRMGPQMNCCSWLRACIDESMRMSPAVAGLLPREVMEGGFSIPSLDLHFPAGVEIGVSSYVVQHNADYVDDPFIFAPERWLHQDNILPEQRQNKENLNSAFAPFSLGHRSCLGKPLVYMELSIAIARLVWEYDIRLAPEQHRDDTTTKEIDQGLRHPAEYQYRDWFLSNNEGVHAEFRKRER
ncbi:hypothetical protein LTR27_011559 [Elasticomyces elasticus]|nr:hypothetical protein LTR27_011559 [Elasticomyces elasticus]